MKDFIGIFDSGMGGISVLKKAAALLPNENFIYYGDNRNAPYGTRPISEIQRLCAAAIDHLLAQEIKALVIACNTATAAYASIVRAEHPELPIIGMEPAVKPASLARSQGRVLALATKATLALDKFSRLMEQYGEGVIPVEGKGLVEIVENGMAGSEAAADALQAVFAPYLNEQIDGIVLGCTHVPFLRRQIETFFPQAQIFDGREGTVRQLERRLIETGRRSASKDAGQIIFQTSGDAEILKSMERLFRTEI